MPPFCSQCGKPTPEHDPSCLVHRLAQQPLPPLAEKTPFANPAAPKPADNAPQTAQQVDTQPIGAAWLMPALVVGILALLAAIGLADSALIDQDEYIGTLLFAGIAIALGTVGTYQQKKGRGMSIAGLVLGGIALLIVLGS